MVTPSFGMTTNRLLVVITIILTSALGVGAIRLRVDLQYQESQQKEKTKEQSAMSAMNGRIAAVEAERSALKSKQEALDAQQAALLATQKVCLGQIARAEAIMQASREFNHRVLAAVDKVK